MLIHLLYTYFLILFFSVVLLPSFLFIFIFAFNIFSVFSCDWLKVLSKYHMILKFLFSMCLPGYNWGTARILVWTSEGCWRKTFRSCEQSTIYSKWSYFWSTTWSWVAWTKTCIRWWCGWHRCSSPSLQWGCFNVETWWIFYFWGINFHFV